VQVVYKLLIISVFLHELLKSPYQKPSRSDHMCSVFKASSRRRLGEQKNEAHWTSHFFRLTLFSLFLSFSRHFSSNMTSPNLALPRLRHHLKGKKG
jgi:hypothetical protein